MGSTLLSGGSLGGGAGGSQGSVGSGGTRRLVRELKLRGIRENVQLEGGDGQPLTLWRRIVLIALALYRMVKLTRLRRLGLKVIRPVTTSLSSSLGLSLTSSTTRTAGRVNLAKLRAEFINEIRVVVSTGIRLIPRVTMLDAHAGFSEALPPRSPPYYRRFSF